MDWKTKYFTKQYYQSDVQIPCDLFQNLSDVFLQKQKNLV